MIEVKGLTKRFGQVVAVDGLTFSVRPGEVTGFLGRNGAGQPITELRRSLLSRQADCRSPGERSSSRAQGCSLPSRPWAISQVVVPTVTTQHFPNDQIVLIPIRDMPPVPLGLIWRTLHENARIRALAKVARSLPP